jgi:outer membrane protein
MQIKFMLAILFFASSLYAKSNSLVKLCEYGIKNNPKIKSYEHRVSASHSAYNQSVDQYMPHFDISGQYGTQNYEYESSIGTTPYQGISYNYQLTLKQPVYRAQLLHMMTDAQAKEKLSLLQEKDEKAKLITQILQASVELIRQKRIIDILGKKTILLEKAYETITDRYQVKLASSTEKSQSLAKLEQSRSELIRAKQIYSYNLYNLRLLTKYEKVEKYISPLLFNMATVEKAFKKANFNRIKNSIRDNTRIMLDKQSTEIAKIQIGLRNSERSPKFDAVLSYGDAGGTIDYVTRRNDSRAMLQLSFPIYQGGYVDDRVKEAKYLYMAAMEDMDNTRLNIKISMEKALQDIKGGLASIQAQKSAVDASKKYFTGTLESYKSGMQSLTDVYLAESDYYDNQLRLVNTEADVISSIMEMYYYGGKANLKYVQTLQNKYFKTGNR